MGFGLGKQKPDACCIGFENRSGGLASSRPVPNPCPRGSKRLKAGDLT
jgi:hypothetical protein